MLIRGWKNWPDTDAMFANSEISTIIRRLSRLEFRRKEYYGHSPL
jgi:hypothetical protein